MAVRKQVRLHKLAKRDWKAFLDSLPGSNEDKEAFVRVYIDDWVRRILPLLRRPGGATRTWECPVGQDWWFRFMVIDGPDVVKVVITDIARRP